MQRLAAGGMAEVWRGIAHFDGEESHPVALKRVLPELASQELYRSMFEDETRLGMLLRHPNIVRVYDGRIVAGSFIMVMELVDGTSLRAILERAHERNACMPVATALWIARELAAALAYAHGATDAMGAPLGIVHRDVSPHNLLLGKNGVVKLADFGLANASVHKTQLADGLQGGKLGYLAPEIIEEKPTTPQVDVFATGIVLWEMLCGRRLFHGQSDRETVQLVAHCDVPTPSSINPRIPREVDELLRAVLARDPSQRLRSAHILARELDHLIAWLDPQVSAKDVALVVGLHLATEPPKPTRTVLPPAQNFISELDELASAEAHQSFGTEPDIWRTDR